MTTAARPPRVAAGAALILAVACASARKKTAEPAPVYGPPRAPTAAPLTPETRAPGVASAPASTSAVPPPRVKPLLPVEQGPSAFHVVIEHSTELHSGLGPTHFIYDRQGTVVRVDGARLVPELGLSRTIRQAIQRTSGSLWFVAGSWPAETYVSVQGVNPGPPSFSLYRGGALRAAKLGGLGSVEPMGAWKGHPMFLIEDQPAADQPWIFLDVRGQPRIAIDQDERSPLLVDTAPGALYYAGESSSRVHRYPGDHVIETAPGLRIVQIAAVSATLAFVLAEDAQRQHLLRIDDGRVEQADQPFPKISSLDAQPNGALWAIADGEAYRKPAQGNWIHVRLPDGIDPFSFERVLALDDTDVWLFGTANVLRTVAAPDAVGWLAIE